MNDLCFTTVVNKKYQRYIPIFFYSLLRQYPEYSARIYLRNKLTDPVRKAIKLTSKMGDAKVIENSFNDFSPKDQYFKTLRWILYNADLAKFKYLYIGDIDMIILEEPKTILEQHLTDCERIGLPYSNIVRYKKQRLVGRHFIVVEPYFEKMAPIIRKYKRRLKAGKLKLGDNDRGNEWILYKMVSESGLELPPHMKKQDKGLCSTHHGLHLGIWRTKPKKPSGDFPRELHESFWRQFKEIEQDPVYRKIVRLTRLYEVKNMKKAYKKFFKQ